MSSFLGITERASESPIQPLPPDASALGSALAAAVGTTLDVAVGWALAATLVEVFAAGPVDAEPVVPDEQPVTAIAVTAANRPVRTRVRTGMSRNLLLRAGAGKRSSSL
jgi:hypothetical protein